MSATTRKEPREDEGSDLTDNTDSEDHISNDGSASSDESSEEVDSVNVEEKEQARTEIRKELSALSFEELEALRTRIGTKEWNEAMFGSKSKPTSAKTRKVVMKKGKKTDQFKRVNKHRPRELSSKVKVPKIRTVVPVVQKKFIRDPRFESLCGEYNEKIWERNFDFISDLRKQEISELRTKIKAEANPDKKNDMRRALQKLVNAEKNKEVKKEKDQKFSKEKEANIQRLKEGKKPYYMKKSTRKYMELVDKYEELKQSGKLESYLKKKRQKNASRDKKTLPTVST